MNEPQIWALIGTIATGVIAVIIDVFTSLRENRKTKELIELTNGIRDILNQNLTMSLLTHDDDIKVRLEGDKREVLHSINDVRGKVGEMKNATDYLDDLRRGFKVNHVTAQDIVDYFTETADVIEEQKGMIRDLNKKVKQLEIENQELRKEQKAFHRQGHSHRHDSGPEL